MWVCGDEVWWVCGCVGVWVCGCGCVGTRCVGVGVDEAVRVTDRPPGVIPAYLSFIRDTVSE